MVKMLKPFYCDYLSVTQVKAWWKGWARPNFMVAHMVS